MNEVKALRSTDTIAVEINSIKEQTMRIVIFNSIEIGRRLCEAKELVEHGEWGKWLEEKVNYSKSTANNLMNIFKEYGSDQLNLLGDNVKNKTYEKLTYSQAVQLLGIPSEEREDFIKKNEIENMTSRELKKAIQDLKKANEEKALAEKKMKELENKSKEEIEKIKKKEEEAREKSLELDKMLKEAKEQLEKETESEQELNRLNDILAEKEAKIKELEERPIEVTYSETKQEEELKEKIQALEEEKALLQKRIDTKKEKPEESEAFKRFKTIWEFINEDFRKLLKELKNIEEVEVQEKCKNGVKGLLDEMYKRL